MRGTGIVFIYQNPRPTPLINRQITLISGFKMLRFKSDILNNLLDFLEPTAHDREGDGSSPQSIQTLTRQV